MEKSKEDELIREEYLGLVENLKSIGEMHVKAFTQLSQVHALNYRVKDPEHLIQKIHRKESSDNVINVKNYKEKITDLIGIRILYKFKNNWDEIDSYIRKTYKTVEKPIAYIRAGDPEEGLAEFDVKVHDFGYRSLHYTVETTPQKDKYIMEIQVRTIFEEAWSEVDHTVRYPDILNNKIINEYSLILNRLAGLGDEMVSNILNLKEEIEKETKEQNEAIEHLAISKEEKNKLEKIIKSKNIAITAMGIKVLYDWFKE